TGYMTRVTPMLIYYIYMDSDPVLKYKIGDKLSLSEDDTVLEMEGLGKYYKENRPFKDLNIVGIVDDDILESTYKSRDRFELESDVKLITTEKGLNNIFEKSSSIVTKDSIGKRILVKTTNNANRGNALSEIKKICANNNYEFKDTIGNKLMLERNIRQDLGLNIIFAVTVLIMVILNLVNTSNASILSRRKELAAMRAIGMSNSQERRMIVGELFYISLSVAFTIIITVVILSIESQSTNIAAGKVSILTFLSGEFIIIIALMIISNLTALAPLAQAKKFSIVEDLKEE
ncbi:MAG: ABC transporter permease, partial [Clostridium sp.]